MVKAAVDILIGTRGRMAKQLEEISAEQWFIQPEGFANNIAWNVGHLVMAQQGLCYGRLGLAIPFGRDNMKQYRAMFGGGTSPADWSEHPDATELLRLFVELPKQMEEDVNSGLFENLTMPEPVDGRFPPPETTMHGLIYNQHHEGLHVGTIGELIGFMNS